MLNYWGYQMKSRVIVTAVLLSSIAAVAPAGAADLGGDCCADLEERVAELEATTARKGNRVVSLTVYGKVNEALQYWDDGFEQNIYQVTNDTSRTRFGMKGKAKISNDLYAGYKIEIGIRTASQKKLTQNNDDAGADLDLRHSEWTIGSKTYGSLTMGEASMAHDGITQIQTAHIKHFANPDIIDAVGDFQVRESGTGNNVENWNNLAMVFEPGEGSRGNLIRYDTPTLAGFKFSAHWGEDDIWGVGLRFAQHLGDFKVAAGVGYGEATEHDEECTADPTRSGSVNIRDASCQELGTSASVMHVPTGLFVTGAYGIRWDDSRAAILKANGLAPDDNVYFYHIQAGIEQKWFSLGKTTVFGGYQERDIGAPINDKSGKLFTSASNGATITDVSMQMWEIGINQHIKAAAMDMYVHYKNYDADVKTASGKVNTEPFQTVIMGSTIKF